MEEPLGDTFLSETLRRRRRAARGRALICVNSEITRHQRGHGKKARPPKILACWRGPVSMPTCSPDRLLFSFPAQVFGDTPTPAGSVTYVDILSDPVPEKHHKDTEVPAALTLKKLKGAIRGVFRNF